MGWRRLPGSQASFDDSLTVEQTSNAFYYPSYLFVVFFLYGLTSTLFSYVVSLFVSSQLAAFAFAAGIQAVLFLLYFIS
jgi:ATP-binding cassette subfamily A (ABC1) protein 3